MVAAASAVDHGADGPQPGGRGGDDSGGGPKVAAKQSPGALPCNDQLPS